MLFDIAWPELLLIGAVALVVIGPKDLPRALRVAGIWVRKARTLSREFQNSVDQMIREAELEEVRRDLQQATEFDVGQQIRQTVDPTGELAEGLKPPAVPDHFEEPTAAAPAAVAETAAVADEAAAPAPASEPAEVVSATAVESTPEPLAAGEAAPEPEAKPARRRKRTKPAAADGEPAPPEA